MIKNTYKFADLSLKFYISTDITYNWAPIFRHTYKNKKS